MYREKKILAIIPARGGSKGLSRKNIKLLLGKPLIGWTIEQAKACEYIDEIFVSTDSIEIAQVAEQFGVSVPELRPAKLADDTATSASFVIYTIEKLRKEGKFFDYIILLEPTSPLREVEDIYKSIEILLSVSEAEGIVGVCRVESDHPDFLVEIDNNFLKPYRETMNVIRRQDLNQLYYFEGTIYLSKIETFLEKKTFYHSKTLPYIVPKWKAFEIDDSEDWFIVESILEHKYRTIVKL
jgi:N-acylneuraminate cytidylyltransferase/CMP-N,N'-diacetyllegionaminic acid synthase